MSNYLTKSDFLIGTKCPRKIYYKKNNYTNHVFEDEFMSLLGEGGILVEYVAKMLFEGGTEIDYKSNEANITMSAKHIEDNDNTILFSPSFRFKKSLSKIDILIKNGNTLTIYDVHSSSIKGQEATFFNKNGTLKADKKKLIEDISFQVYILRNKYPDMKIVPMLMCMDSTKKSKYSNLLNNFNFDKTEEDENGETKSIIEFTGLNKQIVVDNDLFVKINVSEEVDYIMPSIIERVELFSTLIKDKEVINPKVSLNSNCKTCEFKEGKEECWAHMPKHDNDIFDLYHNTTQKINKENVLDSLILEKKTNLEDWPINDLKDGKIIQRQRIQIDNTINNKEWFSTDMLSELKSFKYPLHFIDFETTRPVIPHNKHDKPYEQLAFQWSCHTLNAPGSDVIHKEYISFEKGFPNFKFAESLMNHIKSSGTVFMWHHHERTVLKEIQKQITEREYDNPKLYDWITNITQSETKGRLKDMNRMAKDYYFHPEMKGKTSIKKVLPAIWNNSKYVKTDFNVLSYFTKEQLSYSDPYKILEENPELKCKQLDKLNLGTDAIIAYQQMMRDLYMGDHDNAKNIKKMLIEYCKLDTFAMYIIWVHWLNSLLDDRETIVNDIIKVIKDTDINGIEFKKILVREKDLFKGYSMGNFRDYKNAELRNVYLYETVDNEDILKFEFFHENSSNTRTSKKFFSDMIPTELLKKVYDIISTDKCDTLNNEYIELEEERKELQTKALNDKSLSTKDSDRLRDLNDLTQKIVDNKDNI